MKKRKNEVENRRRSDIVPRSIRSSIGVDSPGAGGFAGSKACIRMLQTALRSIKFQLVTASDTPQSRPTTDPRYGRGMQCQSMHASFLPRFYFEQLDPRYCEIPESHGVTSCATRT